MSLARLLDEQPLAEAAHIGVRNAGTDESLKDQSPRLVEPIYLGAVPCEYEAVDNLAGLLTAQRIFFALDATELPLSVRLVVLSFWWFQRTGAVTLGVRLLSPAGTHMASLSDLADIQHAPTFYCHRVRFSDPGKETISLPEPGTYRIEIWVGAHMIAAYPLVVTEISEDEDKEV